MIKNHILYEVVIWNTILRIDKKRKSGKITGVLSRVSKRYEIQRDSNARSWIDISI